MLTPSVIPVSILLGPFEVGLDKSCRLASLDRGLILIQSRRPGLEFARHAQIFSLGV
jgi:hypothetical protein